MVATEIDIRCVPWSLSTVFFETGSLSEPMHTHPTVSLVTELQESARLHLLSSRTQIPISSFSFYLGIVELNSDVHVMRQIFDHWAVSLVPYLAFLQHSTFRKLPS